MLDLKRMNHRERRAADARLDAAVRVMRNGDWNHVRHNVTPYRKHPHAGVPFSRALLGTQIV